MPYAQVHYPFESKREFEDAFPADFIAEGIDQTRGWFYTLLVLATALFGQPPFKNVIVNGLILARQVHPLPSVVTRVYAPALFILSALEICLQNNHAVIALTTFSL